MRRRVSTDAILDAARDLVAAGGRRAVTLPAIETAAAVSTGSVYYRFRSLDELIAAMWLRAVGRCQDAALEAAHAGGADDPAEQVVTVALAVYDFCLEQPQEALVLGSIRGEDLLERELPAALREQVERANEPIWPLMDRLASRCLQGAGRRSRDLLLLATVDLPFGAARPGVAARRGRAGARRPALAAAVRGMLAATQASATVQV